MQSQPRYSLLCLLIDPGCLPESLTQPSSQPSQNRALTAPNNIQSHSFKMLQRALEEGELVSSGQIQVTSWIAFHDSKTLNFRSLLNCLTCFSLGDDAQFTNINNVHAPKMFDNLNNDQGWISFPLPYSFTMSKALNIYRSQNEPKSCYCQTCSHIAQVSPPAHNQSII